MEVNVKIEYSSNYGANPDSNRGIHVQEVSLDNTLEEREEIAEQICKALVTDGEIGLYQFSVNLMYTAYSNCKYSEEHDETFCDETEVVFDTEISPIDYMDIVIPMIIEQVDDDWGIDEVSPLLYLEKLLIDVEYKGKELSQLTEIVDPFRKEWKLNF